MYKYTAVAQVDSVHDHHVGLVGWPSVSFPVVLRRDQAEASLSERCGTQGLEPGGSGIDPLVYISQVSSAQSLSTAASQSGRPHTHYGMALKLQQLSQQLRQLRCSSSPERRRPTSGATHAAAPNQEQ